MRRVWWKRRYGKPFDTWWAKLEQRLGRQCGIGKGPLGRSAYKYAQRHNQAIHNGRKPR